MTARPTAPWSATSGRCSNRTLTSPSAIPARTSGRGPTGIAAAALYVASLIHGEKRTQREVADVAGVTEVTIRNRYKELIKKLKLAKIVEKSKKK